MRALGCRVGHLQLARHSAQVGEIAEKKVARDTELFWFERWSTPRLTVLPSAR